MSKHQSRSQRRASRIKHALHDYTEWCWSRLVANSMEDDEGFDATPTRRAAERSWARVLRIFKGDEGQAQLAWQTYLDEND